jgi:hypothetical protein
VAIVRHSETSTTAKGRQGTHLYPKESPDAMFVDATTGSFAGDSKLFFHGRRRNRPDL